MLSSKTYIVTSPELITAVNRNSKTLAFNPFIAMIGKRMTGHDDTTSKIVQHNLNGENGPGYVIDVHDGQLTALAPGEHLDELLGPLLDAIEKFLVKLKDGSEVELFAWSRKLMTVSSTAAIYGPTNPFTLDSECSDLFW